MVRTSVSQQPREPQRQGEPAGQAERHRTRVDEERDDQGGRVVALGEVEERVAVRLDRFEREVALAAQREERDDDAGEEREEAQLEPAAPRGGRRVRVGHRQLPRNPKTRLIQPFADGVSPSLSRWSATRRLIDASVG